MEAPEEERTGPITVEAVFKETMAWIQEKEGTGDLDRAAMFPNVPRKEVIG